MKKIMLGLLVIIIFTGSVACGQSEEVSVAPTTTTMYSQADKVYPGTSGARGSSPVTITQVPAPIITVPPAPTTTVPSLSYPEDEAPYSYNAAVPAERMIIRNANMYLVVDDVTDAVAQISSLAAAYGGFVVNSNLYANDSRLYADISFRVESARFNEALQTLRDLAADVRSESTSGQDVTEEYVDLDAQLKNLEITRGQLEELMKKTSEKVTDILQVQRELSSVTGEIERIKGRMQYLEQSSSLAMIQVYLEQSKLAIDFNADTRNVKEGNKVRFYAKISGGFAPYSYEWNFGDGQTSTEEQPSHVYRDKGTYTVSLKVKDDKGTELPFERVDYITVLKGWDAGNAFINVWNGVVALGHFMFYVLIVIVIFCPVWIIVLYFAWWRRRKKVK